MLIRHHIAGMVSLLPHVAMSNVCYLLPLHSPQVFFLHLSHCSPPPCSSCILDQLLLLQLLATHLWNIYFTKVTIYIGRPRTTLSAPSLSLIAALLASVLRQTLLNQPSRSRKCTHRLRPQVFVPTCGLSLSHSMCEASTHPSNSQC